jgi:hypothetical protein
VPSSSSIALLLPIHLKLDEGDVARDEQDVERLGHGVPLGQEVEPPDRPEPPEHGAKRKSDLRLLSAAANSDGLVKRWVANARVRRLCDAQCRKT